MFCTQCGVELEEGDLFCSKCGKGVRADACPPPTRSAVLSRPMDQKKIAGVCAGFARYFNVDVTLMRILWLAGLVFSAGTMFVVYIFAWILMPCDYPAQSAPATERVVAY